MKQAIKWSALVLVVLCCTLGTATAQKVGHLNSEALLMGFPEWTTAQKDFETFGSMIQKQVDDEKKKSLIFILKVTDMKAKGLLSPAEEEKKGKELEMMQSNFEKMANDAQAQLNQKEAELTEPVRKRVQDAIDTVAREQGYSHIIDMASSVILFASPEGDITTAVKAKLSTPK